MEKIRLLHNIGLRINSNYNTREEVLACSDILTFDGVYQSVWMNRDVLKGKRIVLFVMGNYIGGDNKFDVGMPYEKYCTQEQIDDLVGDFGAEVGWHTWSHKNLCTLSDEEAMKEMTPPTPMRYLAYPYGNVDERIATLAKRVGFEGAYSVVQGNDSDFQRNRAYLNW